MLLSALQEGPQEAPLVTLRGGWQAVRRRWEPHVVVIIGRRSCVVIADQHCALLLTRGRVRHALLPARWAG
eukprot:15460836-Alexandrium_andersonii.AAC.1